LGARRADVFRVVLSTALVSVGSGLAGGLLLTLALNQVLARWAAGSSRDLLILFLASAVLSSVAVLACAAPARRASSVDPMTALRYE
jgi:ABC-type antimicrobial peptide transport system permease subunit